MPSPDTIEGIMGELYLVQRIREMESSSSVYDIVMLFDPLLQKYARQLQDPDSYYDLRASLFDIIRQIDVEKMNGKTDAALVKYIRNAVYHQFIHLARAQRRYAQTHILFCELEGPEERERYKSHADSAVAQTKNELTFIEKDFLRRYLTESEYEILVLHFYSRYSIKEIASMKKMSRQFVNKQKVNALRKLRDAFMRNDMS